MPISAWSSTIMQQGTVITSTLVFVHDRKSPVGGGSRQGSRRDNGCANTISHQTDRDRASTHSLK
jgi:hypothetical protein